MNFEVPFPSLMINHFFLELNQQNLIVMHFTPTYHECSMKRVGLAVTWVFAVTKLLTTTTRLQVCHFMTNERETCAKFSVNELYLFQIIRFWGSQHLHNMFGRL